MGIWHYFKGMNVRIRQIKVLSTSSQVTYLRAKALKSFKACVLAVSKKNEVYVWKIENHCLSLSSDLILKICLEDCNTVDSTIYSSFILQANFVKKKQILVVMSQQQHPRLKFF